jgi:hypothetical protein
MIQISTIALKHITHSIIRAKLFHGFISIMELSTVEEIKEKIMLF